MLKKGVLAGKTILVTRPRAQAAELARMLRRHGARVTLAPAIRIVDPSSWSGLDRALRRLKSYDTVIFTSANGVSRFFDRVKKILGQRPSRPRQLFAIGPQTAQALQRAGWPGVGIPDRYEGEALARRLGHVSGRRILIPRAKQARDILPKLLRHRGAVVDVVEVYRTIGDPAGLKRIRQIVRQESADIVTFTSSSTVEHFMKAIPRTKAAQFFYGAVSASIGPITSRTLRRFGVRRVLEAKTYTSAGLVSAIIDKTDYGKY